ncbi:MAG TPA: hypothetical protein VMD02_01170 [Candidatus Omnitrophota bacterium]|nr:hypothetical protein [Candidatus Omnitrophota bacterium]
MENNKRETLNKEKVKLVQKTVKELSLLGSELKQLINIFSIRLDADLAEIRTIIEGRGITGQKIVLPSSKKLSKILKTMKKIRIKPQKARGKDFIKLQKAVRKMVGLLPRQP